MMVLRLLRHGAWLIALPGWIVALAVVCPLARADEHVTLKNGFAFDCVRREVEGERVRLYMTGDGRESANYLEVAASAISNVEALSVPISTLAEAHRATATDLAADPTASEMTGLLARAGEQHHLDADMLASVVKAESGGQVRAVSRTGARGLMQLMPETAAQLGVADSFRADQNIAGGTAYFDQLMTRYHDNVVLALAAYNAGPGAVDRWHGVPPYRETRAYVARVIREFNRRKQLALTASAK